MDPFSLWQTQRWLRWTIHLVMWPMKVGAVVFAILVARLPSLPEKPTTLADERVLRFVWVAEMGSLESLDGRDASFVRDVFRSLTSSGRRRGLTTASTEAARAHSWSWPQERTLSGHLNRAVLPVWLSDHFNRRELVTFWLDRAYFGHGTYGLGAAAKRYFGTTPEHLTLSELAYLVARTRSPSVRDRPRPRRRHGAPPHAAG